MLAGRVTGMLVDEEKIKTPTTTGAVLRIVDFIAYMEVGGKDYWEFVNNPYLPHVYVQPDRPSTDSSHGAFGMTTIAIQDVWSQVGPVNDKLYDNVFRVCEEVSKYAPFFLEEMFSCCMSLVIKAKREYGSAATLGGLSQHLLACYRMHFGGNLSNNQRKKIEKYIATYVGSSSVKKGNYYYVAAKRASTV